MHTHVHSDGLDGVLWIDPSGKLQGSNLFAQNQISQFAQSGLQGQQLLDLIKDKLDSGLRIGTYDCADDSHLPHAEDDSSPVEPAPDDNWQDYQGEDERRHNDVSFSNDTMWLN